MAIVRNRIFDYLLVAVVALELAATMFAASVDGINISKHNLINNAKSPEEAGKALLALPPEEIAKLTEREKSRLRLEPLDLQALSNLALLANLSGKSDISYKFSIEAAKRNLRDPFTQLSAAEVHLKQNDFAQSFYHIDALLSSQPTLGDKVFPVLISLLDNPSATTELAKVLKAEPPWRKSFVTWLAENDTTGQRTFTLFGAIRQEQGTVESEENRALITNQIKLKHYDKAYFYWLDSLGPSQLAKVSGLFDGQFSFEPSNQFFDWNILAAQNVDASVVPSGNDNRGRELRIVFVNNTEAYGHVYQYLHLSPGVYTMSGNRASSSLSTTGGLRWSVSCIEPASPIGSSDVFLAPTANEGFNFQVSVPQTGCEFQVLRLLTASSALLDAKISGDIRFQQLQIEPAK